jgi:hypothetical protein
MFCGDCLKNVRRLRPELWLSNNWLLRHYNAPSETSFFTREFLIKSKMSVVPHPPYFSASPLKIKLKGRHVDIIEVMEALAGCI